MVRLPDEVLSGVVDQCHLQSILVALSLSNRCLHHVSTQKLYREVFFVPGYSCGEVGNAIDHPGDCFQAQVLKLEPFLETLKRSTRLSTFVRRVHLYWDDDASYCSHLKAQYLRLRFLAASSPGRSGIQDIVKVLANLPAIEFLHLSASSEPDEVKISLPWLTSLELVHHDKTNDSYAPNFEELFQRTQTPGLHHLIISRVSRWDDSNSFKPHLSIVGFSNVTNLTLNNSAPPVANLISVFKWFKGLRILNLNMSPIDDYRYNARNGTGSVDPPKLLELVRVHENTLKSVYLEIYWGGGMDGFPMPPPSFSGFSSLQRLGLSLEVLIDFWGDMVESDWPDGEFERDVKPPIHERLPPSLEYLQIEMDRRFLWYDTDAMGWPTEPMTASSDAEELYDWLRGILPLHQTHFRALKKIVIWKNKSSSDNQQIVPEDASAGALKGDFRNHGISLIFSDGSQHIELPSNMG